MYRAIPSVNRHIKQREDQRNRTIHLEHLRNVRPTVPGEQGSWPIVLHRGKKEVALEAKFTQIERENRILLEKITGIVNQGSRRTVASKIVVSAASKSPRSLNVTTRRRRLQDIEVSNARLLKRIQERKSDYEVDKLRQQWKKQKEVIKNISSYPVRIWGDKRAGTSVAVVRQPRLELEKVFDVNRTYELSRVKVIDWHTFHVVVRLDREGLTVTANNSQSKDLKVIEIERGEALDFLREECNNRLEGVFEKLKYDGTNMLLLSSSPPPEDSISSQLRSYEPELQNQPQPARTPSPYMQRASQDDDR